MYARVVKGVKDALPSAAVGADIIVGFPGEQDVHFQRTMEFVSSLPLSYLHVFKYSKRTGTPASRMKNQVPQEILKQRSRALIDLGAEKTHPVPSFLDRQNSAPVGRRTPGSVHGAA